jgi:tRNA(fMet)-specific endonuclease VapC
VSSFYLLDTNAASDLFSQRSPVLRQTRFEARNSGSKVAISVLTQAELLFGFAQKPKATRLRAAYEAFLMDTHVLPWNAQASSSYAQLRLHLKQSGLAIDTMDLLIASQAHSLGATLVTRDRAFRNIAGLVEIVNWATDLH